MPGQPDHFPKQGSTILAKRLHFFDVLDRQPGVDHVPPRSPLLCPIRPAGAVPTLHEPTGPLHFYRLTPVVQLRFRHRLPPVTAVSGVSGVSPSLLFFLRGNRKSVRGQEGEALISLIGLTAEPNGRPIRSKISPKNLGVQLLALGKIPGLLRKHRSRSVRETFTRMLCDCGIAAV